MTHRRLIITTLLFGACASPVLPTVDAPALERAQRLVPETTLDRLELGRRTFSQRCGACHDAYDPRTRTPAQWDHAVAQMSPRAHLDPERQRLVLEYLYAFAR